VFPLATGLLFIGPVPGVVLYGLRLFPVISSLLKPPRVPGIEFPASVEYVCPGAVDGGATVLPERELPRRESSHAETAQQARAQEMIASLFIIGSTVEPRKSHTGRSRCLSKPIIGLRRFAMEATV
jgi:hypothetical protein